MRTRDPIVFSFHKPRFMRIFMFGLSPSFSPFSNCRILHFYVIKFSFQTHIKKLVLPTTRRAQSPDQGHGSGGGGAGPAAAADGGGRGGGPGAAGGPADPLRDLGARSVATPLPFGRQEAVRKVPVTLGKMRRRYDTF